MSLGRLAQMAEEFYALAAVEFTENPPSPDDRDALVAALAALRALRSDLGTLEKDVERELVACSGEKSFVVTGLGEVEVKSSRRRTAWRTDELLPVVVSRIADEPGVLYDDDGERLPWVETAHRLSTRLRDCFSFTPKVGDAKKGTGLRGLGLQPDEFCQEDEAVWAVRLPGRKVA